MDKILAIVPAYNESETIELVIKEIFEKVPGIDVCVVNDGSIDDTAEKARKAGAIVISLPFNMGIGAAVQTGFMYAVQNQYDYAVQVDADGQHNPIYINEMISILKSSNYDVVSGSRFLNKTGYKAPWLRRLGIKILEIINRVFVKQKITDCTSGFRAFNRSALKFLAQIYPEDYPEPEVLIILKKNKFRIVEIPVVMRNRLGGKSSIRGFKSFHYMAKVILAIIMESVKGVKK
ncbi:MAG: glycosyltransferase family 2 protein [candidate division WOR-3 bacterium]|nr:glycosyltransferase family 2 protein [candidate division WOR-3 bacterium]